MIKNLLLDMGGVILDVSYQRVIETFKSYGIENFDKVYTQAKQVEIIDLFEEGKCSAGEFRDGVRKLVGKELSDEQIDKAWFSMILEIPRDAIQLLGVLKLKYRLFLFSNTNVLHIEYLKKEFERQLGFDLFNCVFDKAFFSNEIHHRKPHPESFKYVLEQAGIEAEETLFIDDSKQHLEGASKVGLNTYWLTNGETLIDLYDKKII